MVCLHVKMKPKLNYGVKLGWLALKQKKTGLCISWLLLTDRKLKRTKLSKSNMKIRKMQISDSHTLIWCLFLLGLQKCAGSSCILFFNQYKTSSVCVGAGVGGGEREGGHCNPPWVQLLGQTQTASKSKQVLADQETAGTKVCIACYWPWM